MMRNCVSLVKKIISAAVMLTMLFCLGITVAVPASAADEEIAATDSKIRYTGHWTKDGNNMKGYFQSTIEVRFTGTSLKVKSNRAFAVKIDNGEYEIVNSNSGIVNAASGLSAGNHKATLIISTPIGSAGIGSTQVTGFVLDSGAKLLEPDDAKHIAFIGDSITMGHYGASSNWPSDAGYKDSIAKNYVTLTAQKLDMVPNATAIGGIGIEKANSTDIDELGMAERYFKQGERYSDAKDKAFDTSLYTPDYVVVALGSNGSYDSSTAASTQVVYENMLKKLRAAYPNAKIFCVTPFQSKGIPALDLKKNDIIKQSVTNRKDDGDKNVYYIDATGSIANTAKVLEDPAGQTLDGIHPTFEGHKKIADDLVMSIKSEFLKDSNSGSSSKTSYGNFERPVKVSGTTSNKTDTTEGEVADTSSKKNNTSKKNSTGSKKSSADKNSVVDETVIDNSEIVENADEQTAAEDTAEEKEKGIMDYLWVLIVVAAVVVIALLVVIFLPQIKALFKN